MTAPVLPGCDHGRVDAQAPDVAAGDNLATLPPTVCAAISTEKSSAAGCAHDLPGCDQMSRGTQTSAVAAGEHTAPVLPGCDHRRVDAQRPAVAAGDNLATLPPTISRSLPIGATSAAGCAHDLPGCDHTRRDTHCVAVAAGEPSSEHIAERAMQYSRLNAPLLARAESLNDIERARIAIENRLRQLSIAEAGLQQLDDQLEALHEIEHKITKQLQRDMRNHPLGPWVARQKGVGEKQAARLLASIDNPYWNALHDRPRRGPAELWAYCGYHVLGDGTAARRRKGQRANWSADAKMRAYLVAISCIKATGGEYRAVYDAGREKYAALPAGHAHNRAIRLMCKAILRDIWREARDWHHA